MRHMTHGLGLLVSAAFILVIAATSTAQTCADESEAVNSDPAVQDAIQEFSDMAKETLQDAELLDFCNVLRRRCTLELDGLQQNLTAACQDAGGNMIARDVTIDCDVAFRSLSLPGGVSFVIQDFPGCVGASCSEQNISSQAEEMVDTVLEEIVLPEIQQEIQDALVASKAFTDGECQAPNRTDTVMAESASDRWSTSVWSTALLLLACLGSSV